MYTHANEINSYPYAAIINTYMGGGYVFKVVVGNNLTYLQNQIYLLKKLNWLDKQTAALFVEFTLFNPNINLFQYCSILFEILPSGSIVNSIQLYSIDVLNVNSADLVSSKVLINLLYMCFIVVLIFVEARRFVRIRWEYFKFFYNYIDILLIGFSWATFAMYLYRLNSSYQILNVLKQKGILFYFIYLKK